MTWCEGKSWKHAATAIYRTAHGGVYALCEVCAEELAPRPQPIMFLEGYR